MAAKRQRCQRAKIYFSPGKFIILARKNTPQCPLKPKGR